MSDQHDGLILIVETSTETFDLVKQTMGSHYSYKHVQDSASAVSLCTLLQPDIILVNTALPELNGFELCSRFNSISVTAKIPVIFVLETPVVQEEITAFSLGAVDVFSKPLVPEIVRARLHYCLSARQQRDHQENLISLRTVELQVVNKRLVSLIEEREQSQSNEQDDSELAKSRFLANMSHEFRTPLNGIMGILQILRDSDVSPEHLKLLEMALDSSEHLLRMVNDLLELSKIETATLKLKERCHALREELQPLNAIFSLQARWKGLEYQSSIDSAIPDKIIYDNSRLRHVIINILDNALKFTEKGSVNFAVTLFTKEAAATRHYFHTQTIRYPALLITISDTGIGIPEEKLGAIFEKFDLGEDYITKKFSGSGIGLAIAKEILFQMGGAIWVQSTPGVGSTFYIVFPYIPAQESSDTLEAVSSFSSKSRTDNNTLQVLIADADPVNQSVAAHFLEKNGHATTAVRDYDSALQLLRTQKFDVALIDLQLPGLKELTFVQRIRANKEYGVPANLPIVAVTSMAFYEDLRIALKEGINAVVSKPYQPASLIKAIKRSISMNPPSIRDET